MVIKTKEGKLNDEGINLLATYLEMLLKSSAGYMGDDIELYHNPRSDYHTAMIKDFYSTALSSYNNKFYIIYMSNYDGIELRKEINPNDYSIDDIEDEMGKMYDLEEKYREDDYEDDTQTEKWLEKTEKLGWGMI